MLDLNRPWHVWQHRVDLIHWVIREANSPMPSDYVRRETFDKEFEATYYCTEQRRSLPHVIRVDLGKRHGSIKGYEVELSYIPADCGYFGDFVTYRLDSVETAKLREWLPLVASPVHLWSSHSGTGLFYLTD